MTRPCSILGESINSRKEADGLISSEKRDCPWRTDEELGHICGRECANRKRIMKCRINRCRLTCRSHWDCIRSLRSTKQLWFSLRNAFREMALDYCGTCITHYSYPEENWAKKSPLSFQLCLIFWPSSLSEMFLMFLRRPKNRQKRDNCCHTLKLEL